MDPVIFGSGTYPVAVWTPGTGCVADVISYDTETTISQDPSVITEYVIGTVCDGRKVYFIRRGDLGTFWRMHGDCSVYMHTAVFDLDVTAAASGFSFDSMLHDGLVRDISIYYRLWKCAVDGNMPEKYNLRRMCGEILGVDIDKDGPARTDFGRFYKDDGIEYARIPVSYLQYAATDAIATYETGVFLEERCYEVHVSGDTGCADMEMEDEAYVPWGLLGHDIQLSGDIALRRIERFGLTIDREKVGELEQELQRRLGESNRQLESYGYKPGEKGNRKVYQGILASIEQEYGVRIRRTPKSGEISQKEEDLIPLAGHGFVSAFLAAKEYGRLLNTYVGHLKTRNYHVHPRYTLLVKTGRTSCRNPNIQGLPRSGGVRECVTASAGHVLLACDYSMLELCTLSQILYNRFGGSAMRTLINDGVDLHRRVAAEVLGIREDEVTAEQRGKAKAVNFGIPGGMGNAGLVNYARSSYNVEISEEEAGEWKGKWFELFPEMIGYMADNDKLQRLGSILDMGGYPGDGGPLDMGIAAGIVMRVAGGNNCSSSGREYSGDEVDWAWRQIAGSPAGRMQVFSDSIAGRTGSPGLQRAILPGKTVSIPTGRIRAGCSYTASRNWPFQALAADGAKIAIYNLVKSGYRVVAFIHDEVLVELPEADDYRSAAEDISGIMIKAMNSVCPDVNIATEYAVMRHWSKSAKAVYDKSGRLVPFEMREFLQ